LRILSPGGLILYYVHTFASESPAERRSLFDMQPFLRYLLGVARLAFTAAMALLLLVLIPVAIVPESTLPFVAAFLHREVPVDRPEALVLLLGDESGIRVRAAAEYFRTSGPIEMYMLRGYRRRPKLSWSPPEGYQMLPSGTDYRLRLLKEGIPNDRIHVIENDRSFDTASESAVLASELRKRGVHRVLLLSSLGHTRRLRMIWDRVAPGFERGVLGARDHTVGEWWRRKRGLIAVGYEYGAFVKELARRVWDLWSWKEERFDPHSPFCSASYDC
jgi:uncharacterized SAM-binding protein YcdF (DUF218 family)